MKLAEFSVETAAFIDEPYHDLPEIHFRAIFKVTYYAVQ